MADGDDFPFEKFRRGDVHAIECRVGRQAGTPLIKVVESVNRVAANFLTLVVPRLLHLVRVHVVGEVDARGDVDVLKEGEGGTDGDVMLHPVTPVANQVGVEEFALLGRDAVAELPGVREGDFLIPAFAPGGFLALEGIKAVERDAQVGQGDSDGAVAQALCQVARHGDGESDARESA